MCCNQSCAQYHSLGSHEHCCCCLCVTALILVPQMGCMVQSLLERPSAWTTSSQASNEGQCWSLHVILVLRRRIWLIGLCQIAHAEIRTRVLDMSQQECGQISRDAWPIPDESQQCHQLPKQECQVGAGSGRDFSRDRLPQGRTSLCWQIGGHGPLPPRPAAIP